MLSGTCHCGAVTWTFSTEPSSATACNCTVCARSGVLWIYGILDETVTLSGPTTMYLRRDQQDLEFHHCPTCGNTICWKLAKPGDDGKTQIAVNLRLADQPEKVTDIPIRHFDGLNSFKSLPPSGKTVRDLWF